VHRRKVILVDTLTGNPIDRSWTPTISPEEFQEANQNLEIRNSPWRFCWLSSLDTPPLLTHD
jgi:hypothetical protein